MSFFVKRMGLIPLLEGMNTTITISMILLELFLDSTVDHELPQAFPFWKKEHMVFAYQSELFISYFITLKNEHIFSGIWPKKIMAMCLTESGNQLTLHPKNRGEREHQSIEATHLK